MSNWYYVGGIETVVPYFELGQIAYLYSRSQTRLILHYIYRHSTAALSHNLFVETALVYALTYVTGHSNASISAATITILADSDYYSAGINARGRSLVSSQRFQDFDCSLKNANKTGLGSSAALVTAFVAAVVGHYVPSTLPQLATIEGKARLHNLAQAAHCTAQGKIGSGFDVAAAVYGSCVYRRFSPSILDDLGNAGTSGFASRLKTTIDDKATPKIWDTEIQKSVVKMPKGLRLVMCDVDCGSETPSMVKKVFAWRTENANEAALLWATLQRGNEDLIAELTRLAESRSLDEPDYDNLREIIMTIRSLIREMSTKADVPIEPRVQTQLLDACSAIPGVIGGVVPGAGGFDAIALLVEDEEEVVERLQKFVENHGVQSSEAGGPRIGKIRLLGVKQEKDGAKVEAQDVYQDWLPPN